MIYKKIFIIFLLILSVFSVFSFSSVHAENINVTSSSTERMKFDIDCLKQVLKDNHINNMSDLVSFLGTNFWDITYVFIEGSGHTDINYEFAYFYGSLNNLSNGVNNYSYYGVQQNSFSVRYYYKIRWNAFNGTGLTSIKGVDTLTAPVCWFLIRTVDLFNMDSSQIVENAVNNVNSSVNNVNSSVNNLNNTITEDNSSQDDINLGAHNDEMNAASDTIKKSNLYSKFDKILKDLDYSFTYTDDEVETLPFTFYGKSYALRSDEISSFFKNNNLGFVVTLWQSILWFSLLYTMFLFIRKLYKAFVGGNPVDEVSSTLSSEDNKIIGGF